MEPLGTIDLPYGDLGEAGAKRSRGEPTSTTTRPSRGRPKVNPRDPSHPNWSRLRPSGLLRKPGYLVERSRSTSPARSPTWQPWPNGTRNRQLQDETSPAAEGPPDVSSAGINQVKGRTFHGYRSRLWRLAQRIPPTTPFAKLWKPLFLMLRVLCNVMVQKPGFGDTTVELFFNVVVVLREEDIRSVQIVTSPTSPKPRPGGGDQRTPPPPHCVCGISCSRGGLAEGSRLPGSLPYPSQQPQTTSARRHRPKATLRLGPPTLPWIPPTTQGPAGDVGAKEWGTHGWATWCTHKRKPTKLLLGCASPKVSNWTIRSSLRMDHKQIPPPTRQT